MVRALKLQLSPSGTYYNLSEGITDTLMNNQDLEAHADAYYEYNGTQVFFINTSTNATSYLWLFDDGDTSTLPNPVHVYADGDFIATLIAGNECDLDTFYLPVSVLTGTKDISASRDISIYPNPSPGKFTVTFNPDKNSVADVEIYSAIGDKVFIKKNFRDSDEIDLTGQPGGIYMMMLSSGGNKSVRKLVIQK
jgi:PKD repeat protein